MIFETVTDLAKRKISTFSSWSDICQLKQQEGICLKSFMKNMRPPVNSFLTVSLGTVLSLSQGQFRDGPCNSIS